MSLAILKRRIGNSASALDLPPKEAQPHFDNALLLNGDPLNQLKLDAVEQQEKPKRQHRDLRWAKAKKEV